MFLRKNVKCRSVEYRTSIILNKLYNLFKKLHCSLLLFVLQNKKNYSHRYLRRIKISVPIFPTISDAPPSPVAHLVPRGMDAILSSLEEREKVKERKRERERNEPVEEKGEKGYEITLESGEL